MFGEKYYNKLTSRNIGIIGEEGQKILKEASIPVFGVGGVGGVVAEILVRCGVGDLRIVDIDRFEPSNLNRQIFCFKSSLGVRKIDAAEEFLMDINPSLKLSKFNFTTAETIDEMLDGCSVALMCIDKLVPSIQVARRCRELGVTMLETVAIPYMNLRVYDEESITFEEFHDFPTADKSIEELYSMSDGEMNLLLDRFIGAFAGIDDLLDFYSPEAINKMAKGEFTSFAPMVWMQASMLALETIKILLDWGEISRAPEYALYDPIRHRTLSPKNLSMESSVNGKTV